MKSGRAYASPHSLSRPRRQKVLDRVLPKGPKVDTLQIPGIDRRTLRGCSTTIHFMPPHEAIAHEFSESEMAPPETMTLPPCYHSNPVVQKARDNGDPLPQPLILFLDGVRYTAMLAGRSDSVLGIWVRSWATGKRHLCAALRVSNMCRCGCKGWCTIYPVLSACAFSFMNMATGVRPNFTFDGKQRLDSDPYSVSQAGPALGYTAMLLWITGIRGQSQLSATCIHVAHVSL